MTLVQKVTNPDNWIRTSPSTMETNRHCVQGQKVNGRYEYSATRKEHRLHAAKSLGTFADPNEAKAACRTDYWQLPQDPPYKGVDYNDVLTGKTIHERNAERVAWEAEKVRRRETRPKKKKRAQA